MSCSNLTPVTDQDDRARLSDLARDAYISGMPLVLKELTRELHEMASGFSDNQMILMQDVATDRATTVVTPNPDTLYASAWLNLSTEGFVLSVPSISSRFYVMPLLDAWGDVIGSVGPRTKTRAPFEILIVGPRWRGAVPKGMTVWQSTTSLNWFLGRIEVKSDADLQAARQVQSQIQLIPLTLWLSGVRKVTLTPGPRRPSLPLVPNEQLKTISPREYFKRYAKLLKENPPPQRETSRFAEFGKIGLVVGQDFDETRLSPRQLEAIDGSRDKAKTLLTEFMLRTAEGAPGHWVTFQTREHQPLLKEENLTKAALSISGLGATVMEDIFYTGNSFDEEGDFLTGNCRYQLHFPKSALPPTNDGWSLTIYDEKLRLVANPINRHSISGHDNIVSESDDSFIFYIQSDRPQSPSRINNWLPAPQGRFNLLLRIYRPEASVLNGTWRPPRIERSKP